MLVEHMLGTSIAAWDRGAYDTLWFRFCEGLWDCKGNNFEQYLTRTFLSTLPAKDQILERVENMDRDRPWSERSQKGRFSNWRLHQRPSRATTNSSSLGTSTLGNTHRRGGRGHVVNNVMEDEMEALDLEGEPRDPLTPPQPPTVQGLLHHQWHLHLVPGRCRTRPP